PAKSNAASSATSPATSSDYSTPTRSCTRPRPKRHLDIHRSILIACGRGSPLTVGLTDGNRNDNTQMIPLVDAIPPVRGRRGRPRRRPRKLYGDRAYHSREGRGELRRRHIQATIAAPKTPHGSGL